MDFSIDARHEAFREEVRDFFRQHLPEDIARRGKRGFHLSKEDSLRWQNILYQRGWAAPNWPREEGGTGWTPAQRLIYEEERAAAGAPHGNYGTIAMLGPVLYTFGTPEQKQRFVGPILRGETYWCQGFSEPGSGSDLASLSTRAERQGDHYVVNGSKIWTSHGQHADFIYMLVRTDPTAKKQAGISFLLADMRTPGITVRPIISLDGCHHLNQTFFDNVKVPVANLIGEENKGWSLAKFLLGNERAFGGADLPALQGYSKALKELAVAERKHGRPLIEDRSFALRLAELEMQLHALEMSVTRVVSEGEETSTGGWAIGSILKVRGTELQQKMTDLMMEALGDYGAVFYWNPEGPGVDPAALPPGPDYAAGIGAEFFYRRAATIFGGSNEIQRGIIAKLLFQL